MPAEARLETEERALVRDRFEYEAWATMASAHVRAQGGPLPVTEHAQRQLHLQLQSCADRAHGADARAADFNCEYEVAAARRGVDISQD